MMKTLIWLAMLLLTPAIAVAQQPQMADALRQDGKIWVVVAVFVVTTLGTLLYLFALDRRLTRLEKAAGPMAEARF